MNMTRKLLAIALAALMVFGAATAVFARSYDDVKEESEFAQQIDVLSDIGVIKGTSATEFSPEENVTREQMAMLLFRLMLNKADGGKVNTSAFRDLRDETYFGAISWASGAGYILGTGATTFEPSEGITLQDAMTMVVRALGASSDRMNAGYPWTYIDAAIKLGLDEGLDKVGYTDTLTRAQTAAILYNALTADYLIPRTLSNGSTVFETTTVIEEVFGYEMDSATLVATNDYALGGSAVVKTGYVTLALADGGSLTVKATDITGENANELLGRGFDIIWANDKSTGKPVVLSATVTGEAESFDKATVGDKNAYVEIGGTKYNVVEKFSDSLSTNDNELVVYAFENGAKLTQLKNNAELAARLGFYEIEMIDGKTALLKSFKLGKLDINAAGAINLADGKTAEQLTGGFVNPEKAESGDYVLYRYNSDNKSLEIARVPDLASGIVTRISSGSVRIGDTSYALGCEKGSVSAESVRAALTIGQNATVVIYDGAVVAVVGGVVVSESSQYLLTKTAAQPVFTDGAFRYVATAFIDGATRNIFVSDAGVAANTVYRYIKNGETYTLIAPVVKEGVIASGLGSFVQAGELAAMIDSANKTAITLNANAYYTLDAGDADGSSTSGKLSSVRFITDKNTVIIAGSMINNGVYSSTITVNDGAKVVAVFSDEAGSVETLRYLYISDGSLGSYDYTAQSVKILSFNGYVFTDNRTFAEYTVFNYKTGEVDQKLSVHGALEIGGNYRTGIDGTIVNASDEGVIDAFVSGYTQSTVTAGGETYRLAADCKVVAIGAGNSATAKKIADAYMNNVSFIVSEGVVKAILIGDAPEFTAEAGENGFAVTPDFDADVIDASSLSLKSLKLGETALDASDFKANVDGGKLVFASEKALAAGKYAATFSFGGKTFSVTFEAAEEAAE